MQSFNPGIAVTIPVWAVSSSLAATKEIDVSFSSSSYLDVSVQRVSPLSCDMTPSYRVAPFGNLRINSCLPIPAAYRSLPRPSSPPRAKASPIRSSLLSLSTYAPFATGACPLFSFLKHVNELCESFQTLVENKGVEPLTPCLQSRCSSQLSYTPIVLKNL